MAPRGSIVYFGASQEVNIAWTRKTGETALPPLLFADVQTDVHVSAGAVRTEADGQLPHPARGREHVWKSCVPENQQVLTREWPELERVDAEAGKPDAQRLHVDLHTPAKDNYRFRSGWSRRSPSFRSRSSCR